MRFEIMGSVKVDLKHALQMAHDIESKQLERGLSLQGVRNKSFSPQQLNSEW